MTKFTNDQLTRWKQEINPGPVIGSRINLRRENSEFVGCCPDVYHKEKTGHSDAHPSFKVYKLKSGVWGFKCFSCGASGNIFQFVQAFDKIPFAAAVSKVLAEAGFAGWQDGDTQADTSAPTPAEKKDCTTFPMAQYAQTMAALERATEAQKWLTDRGISMETARKFCLGFVQSAEKITSHNLWLRDGWVLFPTLSADRQTITAVKYRSIIGKKTVVEGQVNSGILRAPDTSTTLYNFLNSDLSDDVWVVEGEPDTLALTQTGQTVVGYPMAGYNPTDDECEVLSKAKRRFLAGDTNKVGVKAMDDLQKRLRGVVYRIVWPNNRMDANDVLTNECGNDPEKFKALVADLKDRATQTESMMVVRQASEITPKLINWLWQDRIPLGKITLFAGNPDNGKSLASTSVAAICSRGDSFPASETDNKPSDVLMLIGEDDPDDTAIPRLIAAQANLKRISFLEAVRPVKMENREIRLDVDIPAIENTLAANPNIRLLVIDPISNYLGEVSMVAEQEVRSILIPLKRAAEKYNIAVLIVMHLNKKSDLDAISRVGGAMAFIGVARCSWLFVRDVKEETPEDAPIPEVKAPDSFSMLRIKNNLVASSRAGLSYSVKVRPVSIEGEDVFTPYVDWGGIIDVSADDALGGSSRRSSEPSAPRGMGRPNEALQAAKAWLGEYLQDGNPHPSAKLISDARSMAGISEKTLRRAYAEVGGVKPKKVGIHCYWQIEPMNEVGTPKNLHNKAV
jgi:putative DNA primase/helicase